MLLVASETGHVYTFATRKLQPMITSESGKALIQTCLNSPDQTPGGPGHQQAVEQRMNPTGFEETELTYAVSEDEGKVCVKLSSDISLRSCTCIRRQCILVVMVLDPDASYLSSILGHAKNLTRVYMVSIAHNIHLLDKYVKLGT